MTLNITNSNYDKCNIQGGCMQKPYVIFINEYILKELKDIIFYIEKLKKLNYRNEELENEIIALFAQINLNFDYHNDTLLKALENISLKKKNAKEFYQKVCKECNKQSYIPKEISNIKDNLSINKIAAIGERIFLNRQKHLTPECSTLYTLFILLLKNMAKNLYEVNSFGYKIPNATNNVFNAINKLDIYKLDEDGFVKIIKNLYKTNYEITNKRYEIYQEKYGRIEERKINLSSHKHKCILVSGRTLKDLEDVLNAIDDTDIDVYTHNGMIFAYQYEKFANNKHLKGHFQKCSDTMQYEFASFPGPIIMGVFQQNKFEGLYRGNLFTTNKIAPFGVSIIKNNDYSEVIKIAEKYSGFNKGQTKEDVTIGYDENHIDNVLNKLEKDIKSDKYKSVLFLGLLNSKTNNIDYYKKLTENLIKPTFIFSLAEDINLPNSVHYDTCYDYNLALKLFNRLYKIKQEKDFEINVVVTDCNSFITMNIMMLNYFGAKNIFIPECKKLPNTPSLKPILSKYFNTHITEYNPIEDAKIINS